MDANERDTFSLSIVAAVLACLFAQWALMLFVLILALPIGVLGALLKTSGVSAQTAQLVGSGAGVLAVLFGSLLTYYFVYRFLRVRTGDWFENRSEFGLAWTRADGNSCLLGSLIGVVLGVIVLLFHRESVPDQWALPAVGFNLSVGAKAALLLMPILLAGIYASVIEELLFRGALYSALRRRCSRASAIALTSALFSVSHLQFVLHWWPGLIYAGVFSLLVLAMRIQTGSLLPAIGAHSTYNLIVVIGILVRSQ